MKCQAEILQHEVVIILKVNMTKFNIEILEGLFVSMWKLCLIHRSSQLIKLIQRILCAKVILPVNMIDVKEVNTAPENTAKKTIFARISIAGSP